ncbi:sugar-binding protein [Thermasporomyces composti]|jgi:hypothetical protein|uniref:Putative glycosyl hydrolase n=1 Tax=Thermasporomyces composti TaxID=696763 RepID=A0A3D9VHG2_THECX|nr:sugar-binding protein [Thermasporomyces composti]REF36741.1 putative glycosyl hydrolase [Thermasporomyces composti]
MTRRLHRRTRTGGLVPALAAALAAALAVTVGAFSPAAHAAQTVDEVVGTFESDQEGWILGLGEEFPGAKGSFERDASDAKVGAWSGLLRGDFSGGGNYVSVSRNLPSLDARALRLWVRTFDATHIRLRMADSTGQWHQQRLVLRSTTEWQQVAVTRFDGGDGYTHWGGANDGVWHGPATGIALLLDRSELSGGQVSGAVRFDEVTMAVTVPDLVLRQVVDGNIVVQPEPVQVRVVTRAEEVTWRVTDFWGERVAEGRLAMTAPEETLTLPLDEVGYYRLTVTAEADDATIATAETSIAVLSPFQRPAGVDSPFGMSVHFLRPNWGYPSFGAVALAAKAGVATTREDASWNAIERTKGEYTFDEFEQLNTALDAHDITWLPIAVYTNPHYDNNATPYSDEGREAFATYTAATIEHFGDETPWVEVYNEFNIPNFGDIGDGPADNRADYYFPLLKRTYEKVKAQDPDVTVVGGATAGVPLDWLEELFQLGGLDYMDALSVHPYVYPAEPEQIGESLAQLDALVRRYNDGEPKPIWITELGWPTHVTSRGVSEATQAAYIVRSHVVAFSKGVERFYWYDFMNDGLDTSYNEHNFGIIRNGADPAGAWTPKPAYVSYAAMTRLLTGATYQREENVVDGVHSHVFAKDGSDIRVVWSDEPTTVSVTTDHPLEVADLMGVTRTYHPHAGRIYLSLDGNPLYVRGDASLAVDDKMTLTLEDDGRVVVGDPVDVVLGIDNTKEPRNPLQGRFEIADTSVPVSARPGQRVAVPVPVSAGDVTGARQLVGRLVVRGRAVARLAVSVDVVHPVSVRATHVLRDGAETLAVTVTSNANRDLALDRLTWTVGGTSGAQPLPSSLPPGASHVVDVPLHLPTGRHSVEVRVSLPEFPDAVHRGTVVLVDHEGLYGIASRSISVDGVLDDLDGVRGVDLAAEGTVVMGDYGGTEDLSGQLWLTWDDEALYLSALITDDAHAQPYTGSDIWSGDSIQIGVAVGMPGETTDFYEYGVALTPEGPRAHRWITVEGEPGPVTDVDVAVTRAEHQTVYELALPWDKLTPFDPDDALLSVSLLVNDNDGNGRKGWIEWGSGIGTGKDPALFKPARLDPTSR